MGESRTISPTKSRWIGSVGKIREIFVLRYLPMDDSDVIAEMTGINPGPLGYKSTVEIRIGGLVHAQVLRTPPSGQRLEDLH